MSFQRIILTSEGLRQYKTNLGAVNSPSLRELFLQAPPSNHVTAEFALGVAIDLLGMEAAIGFVRNVPMVLVSWVHLIEMHGWDRNLREYDLQVNLLMNAIKTTINSQGIHPLKREDAAFAMIQKYCGDNKTLETALVTSLLIHKGLELPWALVATLPQNCTGDTYGVWTGAHATK